MTTLSLQSHTPDVITRKILADLLPLRAASAEDALCDMPLGSFISPGERLSIHIVDADGDCFGPAQFAVMTVKSWKLKRNDQDLPVTCDTVIALDLRGSDLGPVIDLSAEDLFEINSTMFDALNEMVRRPSLRKPVDGADRVEIPVAVPA